MLSNRLQHLTNQWIISLRAYPLAHFVLLFLTVTISMMVETSSSAESMDYLVKCLIV